MADEEHFSLCWNNFNSNLSTGFHESLCRGDLVDVTLVAEGQMVRAHRLVLSVCSPLFRDMFAAMTPNQQAFVVLPNITHAALQDLITFIYCGEVNVKNEALSTFISTAESLQIKGLTDTDTKVETQEITSVITLPTATVIPPPPAPVSAPSGRTSGPRQAPKRVTRQPPQESGDSGTDEVVVRAPLNTAVAQKRAAATATKPTITPAPKRVKITAQSTPNPTPVQVKKQPASVKSEPQNESVMIELPIADEEEIAEENEEPQDPIAEDDIYTDSFYTETQSKTEPASYTLDTTTGEVTATEDQDNSEVRVESEYISGNRGCRKLLVGEYTYTRNKEAKGKTYWSCARAQQDKCKARVLTGGVYPNHWTIVRNAEHNHPPF